MSARRRPGAAPAGTTRSRLLSVRVRPPPSADHYVQRARLHRLLDEVTRAPVTLVIAPAGAGKTSLLSAWTSGSTTPTTWLTLEETDRDVVQLWLDVISALEKAIPGCGELAQGLLRDAGSASAAVDQLLEDLDSLLTSSTVLVLDDLHLIDNEELVALSLARFVRHVPPALHVVLASRRVPKLPLDRLRVRGEVGEVHFAELRFSAGEATEMLARLAPSMPEDQVAAAITRAEGWAAGLQLAALASRSATAGLDLTIPTSGVDVLIHDYLWHEVLEHEPPDIVQAMADIAVIDRVNPGLARALTDRADVTDLLLRAEERGLFVRRLGPEGWFEEHALVRSALLGEMARTAPGRIAEQHVRAARWLEAAGDIPGALDHWLRAGEPGQALRLLAARSTELYDTGQQATVLHTLRGIPVEAAVADIQAMIEFAWCHSMADRRRFAELVEQLSWWMERGPRNKTLRGRVLILRAHVATMNGRWAAGGSLARQALGHFGDSWWRDPLGRFAWNEIAREIALTESWDDAAEEVAEAEAALSRDQRRRVAFEGTRAVGQALAGYPVDALRTAAGLRGAVPVDNMSVLHSEVAIAEAVAHREIGDRARAIFELESLADTLAEPMLYPAILARLELAQAHLDQGDLATAQQSFAKAEALAGGESFGTDGRLWLARTATRLALAAGDIDTARHWSEQQADDRFWGPVSTARVQLASGDAASALAALQTATARCARHEVVLALLQAQSVGNPEEALKFLAAAVDRAAINGMLETIVAEGPGVLDMAERTAWRAPQPWMERLRRAAIGAASPEPAAAHEPLTERERDVLRFLPSRLTLGEIANELYISANTLKFHLKVIYRKLGVSSRAEAAEAARRMSSSTQQNGGGAVGSSRP